MVGSKVVKLKQIPGLVKQATTELDTPSQCVDVTKYTENVKQK
ncbi:hypothetical protein [Nostoc sp.]